MDQNTKTPEQQGQGRNENQDDSRGNMDSQERGTGRQGEKNSTGISNHGMDPIEEQDDLPYRDSVSDDESISDESDQSER